MITATIRNDPYPAAKTIIVSELPKERAWVKIENTSFQVMRIDRRWESNYVYLKSKHGGWLLEGYLEIDK